MKNHYSRTTMSSEPPGETRRQHYSGESYNSTDSASYWMKECYVGLKRSLDGGMKNVGLTGMQWAPIWTLYSEGEVPIAECARKLGTDAGAMTRMFDRLEAKGFVRRLRSAADRRVVTVSLTDAGRAIAGRIPFVIADVLNRTLADFSADDVANLVALLQRFAQACSTVETP
jgi:DNA-binding MarR family transcriptional regulator